ncbi:MAG: hypothetical protein JO353_09785 [Phycisphaerae bacterium]|nr:hypothetical protein [Phycisphaerae bacterium]
MTLRQIILIRRLKRAIIAFLVLLCVLDYARVFGYQGDDWRRFNRSSVHIDQLIDHRTFRAGDTTIRLLGIAESPADGGAFLRKKVNGQPITLILDQPQTRDEQGRLLAVAYLKPGDCLNVDCISNGCAIDDTFSCSIRPDLELAAIKARRLASRLWRQSQ